MFGLPSLRIRGLYLAVATLASQFFIVWALNKFGWFKNYNPAGVITAQPIDHVRPQVRDAAREVPAGAVDRRGAGAGRQEHGARQRRAGWMAVRDMDVAAEVIGIRLLRTKLLAFAVSSFYCGVGGALFAFAYLGTVEPSAFNLDLSFRILFMIIIGGLGTILGSFLGSAFVPLMPILLSVTVRFLDSNLGLHIADSAISNLELMVFGALIIFFLIVEPHGLARLWQIAKEKLRLWPFPH